MNKLIISIISILLLSSGQQLAYCLSSNISQTKDIFEYQNDSIFCKLNFEISTDKLKIKLYIKNLISKKEYKYSGKSFSFIHALNGGTFVDEITKDEFMLNQYYFKNHHGQKEFGIAIDALAGKGFIFDIKNKKLLQFGKFGMLTRVYNDTNQINCQEIQNNFYNKFPISYLLINDGISYKEKIFDLNIINDRSIKLDIGRGFNNEYFDSTNILCLYLITQNENSKITPKVFSITEIGTEIPDSISGRTDKGLKHFYKYEGKDFSLFVSSTDYSIMIIENNITKKKYFLTLISQFTF